MEFKDEKEAIDAAKALQAFLTERLTNARYRARTFETELNGLTSQIKMLETRLQSLNLMLAGWSEPIAPAPAPTPAAASSEDSLKVVVSILVSAKSPMRVKQIAEYAYKHGLITSSKGLEGVAAIVSNTLGRHSPRIFMAQRWGWWHLSEKHQLTLAESVPSQPNGKAANS